MASGHNFNLRTARQTCECTFSPSFHIFNQSLDGSPYSCFNAFTGFAIEAFNASYPTVRVVIVEIKINDPAKTKNESGVL
jgi:hypothetical protein